MGRPRLQRGDIVLCPFPFTDLTGRKSRPAVIVSANPQTDDLVVAFISTVIPPTLALTDYRLDDQHPDFHRTGLKTISLFRLRKLMTLERHLIQRRLGRVSPTIEAELDTRLKLALALE